MRLLPWAVYGVQLGNRRRWNYALNIAQTAEVTMAVDHNGVASATWILVSTTDKPAKYWIIWLWNIGSIWPCRWPVPRAVGVINCVVSIEFWVGLALSGTNVHDAGGKLARTWSIKHHQLIPLPPHPPSMNESPQVKSQAPLDPPDSWNCQALDIIWASTIAITRFDTNTGCFLKAA